LDFLQHPLKHALKEWAVAVEALERGDHADQTLQTSLLAVVQAEVNRGA